VRIGIVTTHSWPIPTPVHTGDVVILDLAIALTEFGHEVVMFAPAGTKAPGKLCEMPASLGASTPTAWECEVAAWNAHRNDLLRCDIIHDFSCEKNIAERTMAEGRPAISTLLGGNYNRPENGRNVCVWSNAMRERALHGYTDYWNTPTPDLAGPATRPLADAHVVYGGVDTDFYCPSGYAKDDYFLWMNRWHPAKGYKQAIQLAKDTGIQLLMAGQFPDDMRWDSEKANAWEAVALAGNCRNITFQWLPAGMVEHHEAKRELYRQARALLYPVQFQEPFGLSMVEAMACGTPVIGNGLGSVYEIVDDSGSICNPEFPDEWRQATLGKWQQSPPDYCRADAVERFSRKAMAERYLKEYEAVIAGNGWGWR
jgi:glycosyltransferase involved in cell wall biosynthesis